MKARFAEITAATAWSGWAVLRERCRAAPKRVLAGIVTLFLFVGVSFQAHASCEKVWRISDTDATCFTSSFSNRYTSGYYEISGSCTNYGEMKIKIDITAATDEVMTISATNTAQTGNTFGRIRNIKCCLDTSDLCYKDQVEKDSNNRITSITISGSTVTATNVDVGTHEKRYDFCADNADDIYCENDPEGDAFTDPYSGDCGGLRCRREHCKSYFPDSPAATGTSACTDFRLYSILWSDNDETPLVDNECPTSLATCTDSGGTSFEAIVQDSDGETGSSGRINVHNMDELNYCEWTAQYNISKKRIVDGDCPEDYQASTE